MPASRTPTTSLRALTVALLGTLTVLALALLGTPANATPSEQDLTNQIDTKSQQFNKAVEKYDGIMDDLKNSKAKSAALTKKTKPLQDKVDAAQTKVGKIAAVAYRGGKASALNAIMDSGSADSMLNSLSTLDVLARGQANQIASLNKAKSSLDKHKQKLDTLIASQSKQAKTAKAKKVSLDKDVEKLKSLRTSAYGSPTNTSTQNYGPPPEVSGNAGKAVDYAWAQLGKPYEMNAAGPDAYDCSGLTMAAWAAAGFSLPHNAAAQYSSTTRIDRGDLQPGDLVFFYNNDHVGIYVGGGSVVHAPTYGEPVQKSSIDSMPANGYGRVG